MTQLTALDSIDDKDEIYYLSKSSDSEADW